MADELKRAKLDSVKCPKCKANLMLKPTEKVCPVGGGSLPKKGRNQNVLVRDNIEQ